VPTVADALAGARYQPPVQSSRKSVLLAGAASRLGERILAQLLAAHEYERIYVLASEQIRSSEGKLVVLPQYDWNIHVDHVIAVVNESNHEPVVYARKRTEIFSSLGPNDILPIAQQAKALSASRFMLVTPINVLSQPTAVYAQLANLMEVELHHIGFESLLLVRPSDHEIRQHRQNIGQRLLHLLVSTATGLMVGLKYTPLSAERTAQAVVKAMLDADLAGLTILEPERLHQLLQA
jgi:hypothetical protein